MLRTLLFQIVRRRWFIVALILGIGTILLPQPEGLTIKGQRTLGILVFAVICFLTEPVPLPAVALLIGVAEVLGGIMTPREMPQSYMSGAVFFIMGSLMIGAALVQLRLDRRIALFLVKLTGSRFLPVISGLSLLAAVLASLVGPHVITATLMPVALALVRYSDADRQERARMACAMLLALAYAAAIGGAGTPSGSARNAIMLQYFHRLYDIDIAYLDWILTVFPLVLLSVPLVVVVCLLTFRPRTRDLTRAIQALKAEASKDRNPGQAIMVILIITLVLVLFLTTGHILGIGTVAVLGASLFMVTGLVRWEQINRGVNWGVVLLYMAAISLGIAMDETRAAGWVAERILGTILPAWFLDGLPFLLAVSLVITVATNVMSGGPAVAVIGPIVLAMAASKAENKELVIMVGFMTAASSSFSYLTVMGNPANSIVFASGEVSPPDFLRAGWKMTLLSTGLLMALAALYWPLIMGEG